MHALKRIDFQKAHYLCAAKVTDEAFHLSVSKREMKEWLLVIPAVPVGNGEKMMHLHNNRSHHQEVGPD